MGNNPHFASFLGGVLNTPQVLLSSIQPLSYFWRVCHDANLEVQCDTEHVVWIWPTGFSPEDWVWRDDGNSFPIAMVMSIGSSHGAVLACKLWLRDTHCTQCLPRLGSLDPQRPPWLLPMAQICSSCFFSNQSALYTLQPVSGFLPILARVSVTWSHATCSRLGVAVGRDSGVDIAGAPLKSCLPGGTPILLLPAVL